MVDATIHDSGGLHLGAFRQLFLDEKATDLVLLNKERSALSPKAGVQLDSKWSQTGIIGGNKACFMVFAFQLRSWL
jgi:hypothetical protein